MTDGSFTAISLMVLVLVALGVRKAPTEQARRGRILLLAVMGLFVAGSYYLNMYVSRPAGALWAVGFWVVLAVWGYRLGDRGLVIIGAVFAVLYLLVGFAMPLMMAA
jgi:hypothetical protein